MGLMKLLLQNCKFRMAMAPWSVRLQLPRIYYKADQCSGLASLVRLFYSAVIVTACLKNSPHPHKTKRRSAKIRRTWQASIIVVIRDVGDGWAGWTIAHCKFSGFSFISVSCHFSCQNSCITIFFCEITMFSSRFLSFNKFFQHQESISNL